jgi:TonB family protein
MPIPKVLRHVSLRVLLPACLIVGASWAALAQDNPPPADAKLPKDPNALLLLAARSSTLTDANMRPWHLKVTYSMIDKSGNVADQGVMEEWWAGATKSKVTYSSANFSQALYVTDKGWFKSGAQVAPPNPLSKLEEQFSRPILVSEQQIQQVIIEREKREERGVKIICLKETGFLTPAGVRSFAGPAYCIDADKPVLQASVLSMPDPVQFDRAGIREFQARYVPTDILVSANGRPVMRAHLDTIEELNTVDEATFAPTPDAQPVHLKVNIAAGVAVGMISRKTAPTYPPDALAARVSGTVALQVLIGTDGHVNELKVMSGPPELQQAAADAVRTWVYRPYLLNGTPVEVNTTVNVVFALGR